MKITQFLPLLLALVLIAALSLFSGAGAQSEGITNLNGLHLSQTSFGTATPQLLIQNGGNNVGLEIRNGSATPVWSVGAGGAVTSTGAETHSGGQTFNNWLRVAAPTAIATATPAAVIDSNGVSNLFEVRDAATPVFTINNGGAVTTQQGLNVLGNATFGVAGTGVDVTLYSGTSEDQFFWDASEEKLTITGTDGQNGLVVADGYTSLADNLLANGGITVDTTAFTVADTSGNTVVSGTLAVSDAVTFAGATTLSQVNAANGSANPLDWTGTLGAFNGDDSFILLDVNPTNANHDGSNNVVTMVDIGGLTGDNEATENAIAIGAGYDFDINATTSFDTGVDGVLVTTVKDPAAPDSNATNEIFEIAGTTPIDTQDTNVHNFLTIDAAIGNSSGGTNSVRGVQVDGVTGDAQVTETGINVDTGWDNAMDVNGQPIVIGADGGVSLDEASDDAVTLAFGAAGGILSVNPGNLKVGSGTAETAQDGNDLYVSDRLEVDGIIEAATNVENIGVPSIATATFTYTAAAGGTGTVATIGDGEIWLITKILVRVTEDFATTGNDGTLVIGDGNDADGFVVLAHAELQAADTEFTGAAAGWQGMAAATIGAYLDGNENGFIYAPSGADETIDWVVDETDGETLTSGAATVYVFYTRIQ